MADGLSQMAYRRWLIAYAMARSDMRYAIRDPRYAIRDPRYAIRDMRSAIRCIIFTMSIKETIEAELANAMRLATKSARPPCAR